ncbi:MAG: hypothetical protein P4L91_12160 [Burkholderiaceae bacterium]|nr:hypothetical protein [Burkholderiaceae bacterium]
MERQIGIKRYCQIGGLCHNGSVEIVFDSKLSEDIPMPALLLIGGFLIG